MTTAYFDATKTKGALEELQAVLDKIDDANRQLLSERNPRTRRELNRQIAIHLQRAYGISNGLEKARKRAQARRKQAEQQGARQ